MPTLAELLLGFVLIASALGVILARKPVHACLAFLLTLLSLAFLYIQLSAQFIGVMQILVYAGAILVLFMIVIVLFQDAHEQLAQFAPQASPTLLIGAGAALMISFLWIAGHLRGLPQGVADVSKEFGTVEALGKALYVDFFFPFEAIILLFLVAVVGALYIGRKAI